MSAKKISKGALKEMLKYALRENLLTPEPNDYMAQVTDSQSYDLQKVIDKMIERGSTLTKAREDRKSCRENFQ